MQADPELQRLRITASLGGEVALYLKRGTHGRDRAGEFDQEAVAGCDEQTSATLFDAPFE
jgi:hypothetical protein